MGDEDEHEHAFGTAAHDAPVTRKDFERAVRALNMSDLELRDAVLKIGAKLVALTDELTRRVDGVEPLPAEPNTPARPPEATVEMSVEAAMGDTLAAIHGQDIQIGTRVSLDMGGSKYGAASPEVPCNELMPLCQARCCKLSFALSTEDLDEGVIRWDYGQPYLIRQRASDSYCVHNDPETHGCTVHAQRPRVCRRYDCRKDARIWVDYEKRIVAQAIVGAYIDRGMGDEFALLERVQARAFVLRREAVSIAESYGDDAAQSGPRPVPRPVDPAASAIPAGWTERPARSAVLVPQPEPEPVLAPASEPASASEPAQ
jgi:Fe-S-cluster containining protein